MHREHEQAGVSRGEQIASVAHVAHVASVAHAKVVVLNQEDMPAKRRTVRAAFASIKRVLFAALGFIFFGIGAVGVFLPILPTTPFLLLSVACFSRSSQRFDDWVRGTRIYKKHLESFIQNRSMTLKTKVSLCALASTMLIIAFIAVDSLHARILIAAVILFKYYYFIFRIRTVKDDEAAEK